MDTTTSERDALFAAQLAEHLQYLRRFARAKARDDELADEAVQETLLAALESGHRFEGRAKLRTWLTGILLHKIHDRFRKGAREITVRDSDLPEDFIDYLHTSSPESVSPPSSTPDHSLHNKQLRKALDRALAELPPRQREAFLLQEVAALDTAHATSLLGVTTGNFWVLVHRARAHLQASLSREGFAPA